MRISARTRAIIAGGALLGAAYLIATNTRPTPEATPDRPTPAVPAVASTPAPGWGPGTANYRLLINDCESDAPTMPCVSWDDVDGGDNGWHLVFRMGTGYRSQPLAQCDTTTGGKLLPCVVPTPEGDSHAVLLRQLQIS